jgi:hypothetical protein
MRRPFAKVGVFRTCRDRRGGLEVTNLHLQWSLPLQIYHRPRYRLFPFLYLMVQKNMTCKLQTNSLYAE